MIFGAGAVPEGVCRSSATWGGVSFLSFLFRGATAMITQYHRAYSVERQWNDATRHCWLLRRYEGKSACFRVLVGTGPRAAGQGSCTQPGWHGVAPSVRVEDQGVGLAGEAIDCNGRLCRTLALAPTHSRPRALRSTKRKGRRKGRRKGKIKGRRKGRSDALRPPLSLRLPLDFRGRASPGRGGLSHRHRE